MYTILVNDDDSLIASPNSDRIMQRSKLFDNFHFLCAQTYRGESIADCTVVLEYKKPVSQEYVTEYLTLSEDLYKDMLEYKLPIDTCFTAEAGNLEVQLTFYRIIMNEDGTVKQQVRKTGTCSVPVYPIANWSSTISDKALTALDQRILELMGAAKELDQLQQSYLEDKADDLLYENNELTLLSNGKKIGTTQKIVDECDVVEFGNDDPEDDDNGFEVVDF